MCYKCKKSGHISKHCKTKKLTKIDIKPAVKRDLQKEVNIVKQKTWCGFETWCIFPSCMKLYHVSDT